MHDLRLHHRWTGDVAKGSIGQQCDTGVHLRLGRLLFLLSVRCQLGIIGGTVFTATEGKDDGILAKLLSGFWDRLWLYYSAHAWFWPR